MTTAAGTPLLASRRGTDGIAASTRTPTEHYDCAAGVLNWEQDWSAGKMRWCCQRSPHCSQSVVRSVTPPELGFGLATTTPMLEPVTVPAGSIAFGEQRNHDCGGDDKAWALERRHWCCTNVDIGCEEKMPIPQTEVSKAHGNIRLEGKLPLEDKFLQLQIESPSHPVAVWASSMLTCVLTATGACVAVVLVTWRSAVLYGCDSLPLSRIRSVSGPGQPERGVVRWLRAAHLYRAVRSPDQKSEVQLM